MHIAGIEPYGISKEKVGEREAKTLIGFNETKVKKRLEEKKDLLATKEDLADILFVNSDYAIRHGISLSF